MGGDYAIIPDAELPLSLCAAFAAQPSTSSVLVTSTGFHPITAGRLPEPARTWVERHIRSQDLTVEAGMTGDLDKALKALALDPLVAHLTLPDIQAMGLQLLRANAQHLPQFQGRL